MTARGIDFTGIAYLVALGVGGFVVYRLVQSVPSVNTAVRNAASAVRDAAGAALNAVNPVNPDNVFNRGFEATLKAATGRTMADFFPGTRPDPARLASQFNAADVDDAELGVAMRRALLRNEGLFTSPADRDDAELGAAMSAASGAPFYDYSKLARGVIR